MVERSETSSRPVGSAVRTVGVNLPKVLLNVRTPYCWHSADNQVTANRLYCRQRFVESDTGSYRFPWRRSVGNSFRFRRMQGNELRLLKLELGRHDLAVSFAPSVCGGLKLKVVRGSTGAGSPPNLQGGEANPNEIAISKRSDGWFLSGQWGVATLDVKTAGGVAEFIARNLLAAGDLSAGVEDAIRCGLCKAVSHHDWYRTAHVLRRKELTECGWRLLGDVEVDELWGQASKEYSFKLSVGSAVEQAMKVDKAATTVSVKPFSDIFSRDILEYLRVNSGLWTAFATVCCRIGIDNERFYVLDLNHDCFEFTPSRATQSRSFGFPVGLVCIDSLIVVINEAWTCGCIALPSNQSIVCFGAIFQDEFASEAAAFISRG